MPSTVANPAARTDLLSSVSRPGLAKVHTASHGNPVMHQEIGACLDEVRRVSGLTIDEFAAVLDRDARQVGKWLTGQERPQVETVLAVERFRAPLVIAMARLAPGGP